MAAPTALACVLPVVKSVLFDSVAGRCRASCQLVITRGARRTSKPKHYWPKRSSGYTERLTPENQVFLAEAVEDTYSKSPLKVEPVARNTWTTRTLRTGVIGIKLGVLPQWTKDGQKFVTTLVQVLDNHVVNYIPPEIYATYPTYRQKWSKGYGCAIVGALSCDPKLFTKEYNSRFLPSGLPPKRKVGRFLVTPDAAIQPGTPLNVMHFRVGDYIDCQAKTIGHGFQGVVKRWGMKGGPASHGTTKAHRRRGATGGGGNKAAIWKGTRMPGHMGMEWRTMRGLKIWRINTQYNVLYVNGTVPGPTHCYVRVFDSTLPNRKRELAERPPPMPTWYPEDAEEKLPWEYCDDDLYQFTEQTITLQEQNKK